MAGVTEIRVTVTRQYGQDVVYPACDNAEKFCRIAGTRTLTPQVIALIKSMTIRVFVVPSEPSEL